MTYEVEESPEARDELLGAIEFYEEARHGLGGELLDRVERAVADVRADPHAWPRLPGWDGSHDVRSRRAASFRYRVIYVVDGDRIRILAYAHTSRKPGYWRDT